MEAPSLALIIKVVLKELERPSCHFRADVLAGRHCVREVHAGPHARLPAELLELCPRGEAQGRGACGGDAWLPQRGPWRPFYGPPQLIAAQQQT